MYNYYRPDGVHSCDHTFRIEMYSISSDSGKYNMYIIVDCPNPGIRTMSLKYFFRLVKVHTLQKFSSMVTNTQMVKIWRSHLPGWLSDFDWGYEASTRQLCRKLISRRSRRDFFLQRASISPHLPPK